MLLVSRLMRALNAYVMWVSKVMVYYHACKIIACKATVMKMRLVSILQMTSNVNATQATLETDYHVFKIIA